MPSAPATSRWCSTRRPGTGRAAATRRRSTSTSTTSARICAAASAVCSTSTTTTIRVIARHLPPRHFKLSYLVTAWTQRPEDEHRLLSSLLGCFLRYDALPDRAARRAAGRARAAGAADGRPAAARGPRLRRRLVGAGWRAQAVARRRGQRAGRDRAALRGRAAGQRATVSISMGGQTGWPPARGASGGAPPGNRDRARQRCGRHAVRRSNRDRRRASPTCWTARSLVEDRVARSGRRTPGRRPGPDDPFRGLYLTDETVDRLLVGTVDAADPSPPHDAAHAASGSRPMPTDWRPTALGCGCAGWPGSAGLTDLDVELLVDRAAARSRLPLRTALRLPQRRRDPAPRIGRAGPGAGRAIGHRPRQRAAGWSRAGRCVGRGLLAVEDDDRPFLDPGAAGARPGGRAPAR